ncbi:prepilin-type N-terminal cleavage/methylation domain-containing protein [Paenibacillus typhae]|uniref:prepilin-type N-terminal cleavage/methylation domain-containing protein n=1 Tax=Paenibacillus typhae TaxID=1174501 RepID=UPI001C8DE5E6|nr:prepilin-type N-terminal cleavage/methylation domain-containing protein [Paenibacillus typhae]MBY0009487.1 prepilin-type N-terminal cleavage/methylation domain-containing protein [Paenibacillus typhae]
MLAQAIRKKLGKAGKEEKGFTLIELLAVIVIIGIIAVIAIPMISNIIGNTKTNADVATGRQIYDAARLYIINEKNGSFANETVTLTNLTGKYLESGIRLPSSKSTISSVNVKFDTNGVLEYVNITPKPEGSTAATSPATGGNYSKDQIMSAQASPTT